MKKILFAAAMLFMGLGSANAQIAYEKAGFFDNVYLGVEAGVTTPLTFDHMFPMNTTAGVKVGKLFSPLFGANLEALVGFGDNGIANSHTFARVFNIGLNGTANLTNIFCGYRADRTFQVSTEIGVGYSIIYGDPYLISVNNMGDDTELTGKSGLIFAWNLGQKKAWQLYAEPAILWNLTPGPGDAIHFDKKFAQLGLFVGLNYKFLTSNGTHNFKEWNIGQLNDEINSLRAQLAEKPKVVTKEVVKEVVKELPGKEIRIENLVFVTFEQAKYYLTPQAKKALNAVASGSHVQIIGTASPEGSKEFNDRLSQNRANIVAEYLSSRGVIVDEALGKGVQGVTSNRLAIVYVK
ncbi:OmpA family protein [Hallella seregens]|uniref:OmpA family protein n=1 Tax=Hallella seregens ATCC 51272 TaxID=1336250 RepID=A0ABV5ZIW4_9BACT|nr:OmpA family protein [Hallella seregens]